MANPTTNYGFVLPTSSDLVTDLPADFDIALQGVDTRLKALQPGTTLGDIAYSSATANTNTRLGIGSNGNVLTVSGGVPVWSAPAGGKILQVVFGQTVTAGSTASTTYSDTTLTATITPTANTSDVYVFVAHTQCYVPSNKLINLRLVRNSTTLRTYENQLNNSAGTFTGGVIFNHKDSPATTSATTYKTQFASTASGGTVEVQVNGNYSTIILLEVGA